MHVVHPDVDVVVAEFTGVVADVMQQGGDHNGPVLAGLLGEDAFFRIRVALPGEVTEHNADRIEGDLLVWEIDWTSTEGRTLSAVSRPASGGGNDMGLVAVLVGVAAVALVVVFAARSRRSR